MLRNVAFENNIPIELNILHQNQTTITLVGTVNIENDIPEPSFLVDILDHTSIEQIKADGAEKGHIN
jgi:antitoxin component of RelBE/YafQ-DinJ toxin-antitoxin module|tara:strand:- start:59 stop:259 length:201 start_codon:yes stop_codon:yes gene_type:complete